MALHIFEIFIYNYKFLETIFFQYLLISSISYTVKFYITVNKSYEIDHFWIREIIGMKAGKEH